MQTQPPSDFLPVRAFAKYQQTLISVSWKSAGSGFESLAAHKSPGHSRDLGFFMPEEHPLFDLFSRGSVPPTRPCTSSSS
jgi:hypothetical protein